VLACEYGPECDVWSAGVVLYTMLVGYPPFKARTDSGTLARVRAGTFSFERDGWSGVSSEAKDLITQMLTMDVTKRPSAAELLDHPWFEVATHHGAGCAGGHSARVGGEDYLARLSAYAHSSRMARLALKVIASSVSTDEAERLRRAFREADADGDGRLTVAQLHSALKAVGIAEQQAAADVDEFAEVCRVDDHIEAGKEVGTVDYGEFLAALFDADRVIHTRPDVLLAAFEKLDVDHDGFIGPEDLQRALGGDSSAEEAREAIRELLLTDDPEHLSDGKVSRATFVASLMHHHAEYHPSEGGTGGGTATGRGGGKSGGGENSAEGSGGGGTLAVPPGSGGGAHRRPSTDRRRRSIDRRRAQALAADGAAGRSTGSPAPTPPPPGLPRPPSRGVFGSKKGADGSSAVVNAVADAK
jgi:Ca2+-binding EF-hand superfamily protein